MSASSRARDWVARYGVGAALAALALVAAVFVHGFFGLENLSTILLHVSVNGILALGLTFVIVTGGIGLSGGSGGGFPGGFAAGGLPRPGGFGRRRRAGGPVPAGGGGP